MNGFEQNKGTNLKLKSASRLETERSETLLNSGSTQHLKTLLNESFASTIRCKMNRLLNLDHL